MSSPLRSITNLSPNQHQNPPKVSPRKRRRLDVTSKKENLSLTRIERVPNVVNLLKSRELGVASCRLPRSIPLNMASKSTWACSVLDYGNSFPLLSCAYSSSEYDVELSLTSIIEGDMLVVANDFGSIKTVTTPGDEPVELRHSLVTGHPRAVFDLKLVHQDKHLLTASGDGAGLVWDFNLGKPLYAFAGHNSSVKSIAACPDDEALYVTGSRGGSIQVWDTRVSHGICGANLPAYKPVQVITQAHDVTGRSDSLGQASVVQVDFLDKQTIISAGVADGLVKLWDFRTTGSKPTRQNHVAASDFGGQRARGVISFAFDSCKRKVYACRTDNKVYSYNSKCLGQYLDVYQSPKFSTAGNMYITTSLSSDDEWLACGNNVGGIALWSTKAPRKNCILLDGPENDVHVVRWNPTKSQELATLSDEAVVRYWQANEELASQTRLDKPQGNFVAREDE